MLGLTGRLDTLQAAVLRVKLKCIGRWNRMRISAAQEYGRLLEGAVRPYAAEGRKHIYHVYAVRIPRRDAVFGRLREKGVGAIIHYPIPLHRQKAYARLGYRRGDFPVSEKVCGEIVSLPMFPHIKDKQIAFVAETLKWALKR